MVSFTIEGTIDGAHYVFGTGRNLFVRIFWICLFAVSVFGLFYYINSSYVKWKLEPDILTKSEYKEFQNRMQYKFTVCPQQFDVKILRGKGRKKDSMSHEECSVLDVYEKWCNANDVTFEDHCNSKYSSLNYSEVASILRHAQGDHKAVAVTDEDDESFTVNDNFTSLNVLTSFGACSTFNKLSKSIFKEKWMEEVYGLMKDGEVESNWTFDSDLSPPLNPGGASGYNIASLGSVNNSCNGSSYKVIVHQPDEIATIFHPTIDVELESWTFVYVETKIQRASENLRVLDSDIRKCYFDGEKELKHFKRYSKYYCMLECFAEVHDCYPLEIPKLNEIKKDFCSIDKFAGFDEHSQKYKTCKCYSKCNYLQYELTKQKVDRFYRINAKSVVTITNFSFMILETERFMTYAFANFIADIGGYLGLFLGCSILSIVEIFFHLACKVLNFFRRNDDSDRHDLRKVVKTLRNLTETIDNIQREWTAHQSQCSLNEDHQSNESAKDLMREVFEIQEELVQLMEKDEEENEPHHSALHGPSRKSLLDIEVLELI